MARLVRALWLGLLVLCLGTNGCQTDDPAAGAPHGGTNYEDLDRRLAALEQAIGTGTGTGGGLPAGCTGCITPQMLDINGNTPPGCFLRSDLSCSNGVVLNGAGGPATDNELVLFTGTSADGTNAVKPFPYNTTCTSATPGTPWGHCTALGVSSARLMMDTDGALIAPNGVKSFPHQVAPGNALRTPVNTVAGTKLCTDETETGDLAFKADSDGIVRVCYGGGAHAVIPQITGTLAPGMILVGTGPNSAAWQALGVPNSTSTSTVTSTSATSSTSVTSTSSTSTSSTTSTTVAGTCQKESTWDFAGTAVGGSRSLFNESVDNSPRQEVKNTFGDVTICQVDVCVGRGMTVSGNIWVEIWQSVPTHLIPSQIGTDSATKNAQTQITNAIASPSGTCGSAGNGTLLSFTWSSNPVVSSTDFWVALQTDIGAGTNLEVGDDGAGSTAAAFGGTGYNFWGGNADRSRDAIMTIWRIQ